MKIKFIPNCGLAVHIDGQLAGVITKPGASISPDENGFSDVSEKTRNLWSNYTDIDADEPPPFKDFDMSTFFATKFCQDMKFEGEFFEVEFSITTLY